MSGISLCSVGSFPYFVFVSGSSYRNDPLWIKTASLQISLPDFRTANRAQIRDWFLRRCTISVIVVVLPQFWDRLTRP
jgi:hypothetical protein